MLKMFSVPSGGAALTVAFALAVVGCATNPVTGERQLSLISESQEIQMGQEAAGQAAQSLGLVDDAELQSYVQRIGASLAVDSERPDLPWSFRVVDDAVPNAFALPGGFIFVTRGLLNLMDSEAELASVLGHEIGHVTARHSVTQISRAQLAQLGVGLGGILVPELQQFGGLANTGLGLLFLKYGRDAERQADDLGFNYALADNYDVREMADVFAALRRVGEAEGQSPVPSWMATHPYPDERIEAVRERLASLTQPLDNTISRQREYLGHIEGLVYGENPRNGFFRQGVFYHPELRFRFSVPNEWRTQNLPQAVMAISPQQDAVLQLTLAQDADPATASRRFLSQQGVQPGQSTRESINGIPAVISSFQGQTEQGVLQGLVAFFSYDNRTYQMVTYAPASRFSAYDRLFRQVIGTFAPETDPAILNVQPKRLGVVQLEQAMTLAQFNDRYPSAIPLEELAILNQVEGAASTLPAGGWAKRVLPGN